METTQLDNNLKDKNLIGKSEAFRQDFVRKIWHDTKESNPYPKNKFSHFWDNNIVESRKKWDFVTVASNPFNG